MPVEGLRRTWEWVGGRVEMGSRKITFISGKPMIFVYLHHVVTI